MENINKAFILLDKTLKEKKELARVNNISPKNPNGETFASDRTDYDPEGKNCIQVDSNPLIWKCTESDHNGYYVFFLFKTECKYKKCNAEYRDTILKESELRKVLLKNDIAEVGITIEDSLHAPTETCWGYKFQGYKYYIIKDGELTITRSRAKIRKIYNGKDLLRTKPYMVRVNVNNKSEQYYTKEFTEVNKRTKELFTCNIDGKPYYIASEKALVELCVKIARTEKKEIFIEMLGGINEIINSYIYEQPLDIKGFFSYNTIELCSILSLKNVNEYDENPKFIESSDIEIDSDIKIHGLKLYQRI